jgi:uncharacterized protein YndB with AHSA1/START domain
VDAINTDHLTPIIPADRMIVFTRVFNAPRGRVFDSWTRPEHVARWYGCHDSPLPICEIDLRPSGAYRFIAHAPDGNDYAISGVYCEISRPKRLVYTERIESDPDTLGVVVSTFDDRDGQTIVRGTALYRTAEDRGRVLQMGMAQGAAERLDRIAELLRTMS